MSFNGNSKYSVLPYVCKRAIELLCMDNVLDMTFLWNSHSHLFDELMMDAAGVEQIEKEELTGALNKIASSVKNRNYCSTVINDELLPLLEKLLNNSKDKIDFNDDYAILGSKSGLYTLFDKRSNQLINSTDDPLWEADRKAEALYNPRMRRFYILGVELGYLAYAIWSKSYRAIDIVVFDSEDNIRVAREYGFLNRINDSSIKYIISDNISELFDEFTSQDELIEYTGYYITENIPIRAGNKREPIESFRDNQVWVKSYTPRYSINYWKNLQNATIGFEELKRLMENKVSYSEAEYVVVAAGPSINENIDFLKESVGKRIIIAVSTALKKLSNLGVKPDIITIMDPLPGLMEHVKDLEQFTFGIPLVAESVSYWEFVEHHNGPKCRVLGNDYEETLQEAKNNNINLWNEGRTVAVFSMELAAKLGAKKIHLIGTDFAYPQNKKYADSNRTDAKCEIEVESVDGGMVGSTNVFKLFIEDTEKLIIQYHEKIEFYNYSRHGAYLRGAFCGKWWEKNPNIGEYSKYILRLKDDDLLGWKEKYFLMWQIIIKYISSGISEEETFWANTAGLFEGIKKGYLAELQINSVSNAKRSNLIVLLTSNFCLMEDELSQKVLEDGYKIRHQLGKDVLIINTDEYVGGKLVAFENAIYPNKDDSLIAEQEIAYMGEKYPYFQMPKGMPDVEVSGMVINYLEKLNPQSVICYDPFSLFSAACSNIFTVENR